MVLRTQPGHHCQYGMRGGLAGGVRDRMRGFQNFYPLRRHRMSVAGHHRAFERHVRPSRFQRGCHRGSGLAGADHDVAAFPGCGQLFGQDEFRPGRRNSGVEHPPQKFGVIFLHHAYMQWHKE